MNDKQREFIERTSERIAIVVQDMPEGKDKDVAVGSYYISEVRNKANHIWDVARVKSLVTAMKKYGGLDKDIECIREAWSFWNVKS